MSNELHWLEAKLAERPPPLPESETERLWKQLPPDAQLLTLTVEEMAAVIASAARRQDADKEETRPCD